MGSRYLCELIAQMPAVAAVHEGPEHVYIHSNPAHDAAVGHRPVLGLPVRQAMPELAGQGVLERFDSVYRTGQPSRTDRLRVRIDNGRDQPEERWYMQILQPWRGADGRVRGVLSMAFDISDQVRTEQATESSHTRFATIFNQAAVGIAVLSPDGRWRDVNQCICEMLGYQREALLQMSFVDIAHPDDLEKDLEQARRMVAGEIDSYRMEKRYIRSDGSILWADLMISMVSRGPRAEVIAVIQDIDERKRYEQALEAADHRKDTFLAVLGHELGNPLAAMRYAVSLLELGPGPAGSARAIEIIDRQARLMDRLIGDLRDLARVRRGCLHLEKQVVDLRDIIAGVATDQHRSMSDKSLDLVVQMPDEPVRALVDPARIAQVMINLLQNATRHTDRGGQIVLSMRQQDDQAIISVRDTGQGIPEDELPHIFEAFRQVGGPGRVVGSLGLGLALVKQLVELHGGAVCAHSEGGRPGAELVLTLPLE